MADISDVGTRIAQLCVDAVYPNGAAAASISGPARLYQGWPEPKQLDNDLIGKMVDPVTGMIVENGVGSISHVSVYPHGSGGQGATQVFEEDKVIVPAQHGITATAVGSSLTFTGSPTPGEYVSIIADQRKAYSRVGDTLAAILTALLADIQVDFPTAALVGTTLTVPTVAPVARIGAPATMGRLIHRQSQNFMVTVWAATPEERSKLAAAIDLKLKLNLVLTFPDTSQGIMTFVSHNETDDWSNNALYRRDMIYAVEYGTVETFPAYEVTVVSVNTDAGGGPSTTVF